MSIYSEQRNNYQSRFIENVNDVNAYKELILKMLLFNELIKELVKWKMEKNGQTEQEVLKDLSFVPLMKCLYIVCLLTVDTENNSNNNESLFEPFNGFIAYSKGPVNEDCYFFMDKLPDYTIEVNKDGVEELTRKHSYRKTLSLRIDSLVNEINKDMAGSINNNIDLISDYNKYEKMLDKAIDVLKGASFFPGFRERERLIDLTHMRVWKDAYYDEKQGSHEMNTSMDRNKMKLLEEAMFLKWNIAV